MKHLATFKIKRYPGSVYTERIVWTCSCGKNGTLRDGAVVLTLAKAKRAARRHVESAKTVA